MIANALLAVAQLDTTPAVDHEEARWVAQARAGHEPAYQWLLDRYRFRVVRLAAHVLGRASDAEDIAQEAFILAFRQINRLRADAGFRPWLYRIVVRLCLDKKRKASWSAEMPMDASETAGSDRSFTDAAANKVVVADLLKQLSPTVRSVLVLRELDGLEYEEIADILEIPVGTVRSRLNTARAQFRTLWLAATEVNDNA